MTLTQPLPTAVLVPLFAMVTCAAFTDAKRRRIPNWLTGAGILIAFAVHLAIEGWSGLAFSATGMLAGFTLYFLLYLVRALGAGDVKLMAAVGAFAGASVWLHIFLATALIGATAALLMALAKGKLQSTVWNAAFIANELLHFRAPYVADNSLDVKSPASLTLPHGIAIALGVFLLPFSHYGAGLLPF